MIEANEEVNWGKIFDMFLSLPPLIKKPGTNIYQIPDQVFRVGLNFPASNAVEVVRSKE